MTTINLSTTINATPEQVWPLLADFGGVAAWNPSVKTSRLTSSQSVGEGITRECTLSPMGTVQERVTAWEDQRLMGIEIFEFKNVPGMRGGAAIFELVPQAGRTVVNVTFDYTVGLGLVGAGMNSMGMRRKFIKSMKGLLAGLKHHVETGEAIDGFKGLPVDEVAVA